MGEWTIHIDVPEGTSLEGSEEVIAKSLAREMDGIPGIAEIQPAMLEQPNHIHLICYAQPFDERKATAGGDDRRHAAASAQAPVEQAEHHDHAIRSAAARSGGNFAINANLLSPDLARLTDYSMRLLVKAQTMPSLTDVNVDPGAEPGNPRHCRSPPGCRPWGPDGDCRQHAAPRRGG